MHRTSQTTLELINQLSNERQSLWRLAGRQKLTCDQVDRIQTINSEVNRLWIQHRTELAGSHTRLQPEDRLHTDVFRDFVDRQNLTGATKERLSLGESVGMSDARELWREVKADAQAKRERKARLNRTLKEIRTMPQRYRTATRPLDTGIPLS